MVANILVTKSSYRAICQIYTVDMPAFNPVVQRRLDALASELAPSTKDEFEAEVVFELMADSAVRLAETAAIPDYLPPLAYRLTKERLGASKRTGRPGGDESRDIVFVSLSGGGRGQIAAALTTLLSGNRVTVHSAGTAVHGQIDPVVSTAISELGIDVSEAFARPMTPEVLGATDVVVTMGTASVYSTSPTACATKTGESAIPSAHSSMRCAACAMTSSAGSARCSSSLGVEAARLTAPKATRHPASARPGPVVVDLIPD